MKIEKLNDNQIRCILDKNDLEQRELQLSELAYGSSKAKALFSDMMEQAADEFGFEVDNMPLMIEAIPVSFDCLILVVTKVEDPDELDTRFSRFSNLGDDEDVLMEDDEMDEEFSDDEELPFPVDMPMADAGSEEDAVSDSKTSSSEPGQVEEDDLLDIMEPFHKAIAKAKQELLKKKKEEARPRKTGDQVFAFDSLDEVLRLSDYLVPFYKGDSLLFKDGLQEVYYLVLVRDGSDEDLYRRACTICSDHGEGIMTSYASLAYFREHFQMICDHKAIKTLHQLNG